MCECKVFPREESRSSDALIGLDLHHTSKVRPRISADYLDGRRR